KAVIGRDRKRVLVLGDYVCTYALDCKGSLAVMLNVMEGLRGRKLDRDVYFCAFSREETGALGGCYAARTLPCEHIIAIEVGPVAREYQTQNCEKPILLYQDAMGVYDEDGNTELAKAAESAGVDVQRAVLATFGSDASVSARYGQLARANCICFPTENTHGYEIASLSGIENTAKVLLAYLSG
ncbi:MAG: M42 family metallopeptidase, partial [Planctomycetes bacterium]|nr:M42 family metallopeptidase [Planctomycetota bacterium]